MSGWRPLIQAQVIVTAGERAMGAQVRGIAPEELERRQQIVSKVVAGRVSDFGREGALMAGSRLAQRLGLGAGSDITLLSPQGSETVIGTVPRMKAYPIAGLFEIGMYEFDLSTIYMPLDQAQIFFRYPDAANAIEIFVDDPERVWQIRREIDLALGSGWATVDWQQAHSSIVNALAVERNVMFIILSLIILVAAFNILSGQYMLVKEGRDIAILRTMGLRAEWYCASSS